MNCFGKDTGANSNSQEIIQKIFCQLSRWRSCNVCCYLRVLQKHQFCLFSFALCLKYIFHISLDNPKKDTVTSKTNQTQLEVTQVFSLLRTSDELTLLKKNHVVRMITLILVYTVVVVCLASEGLSD